MKYDIFETNKNIFKGISTIIIFLLFGLTDILYTPLYLINIKYSDTFLDIYSILTQFFIIFVIILIFKKELENYFAKYKENMSELFKSYIKYWFIAYGLMFASNILIQPFIKEMAKNQQAVQSIIETRPVYALISMAIIAPILEEFIFRLSLRKIIKSDLIFIIFSGLIFGAMHIIGSATCWQDWLFIITYGIPGSVFAYTYVKSKNIFVPISLHMVHNGFAVVVQILLMILNFFAI